jgi:hypothetical protein
MVLPPCESGQLGGDCGRQGDAGSGNVLQQKVGSASVGWYEGWFKRQASGGCQNSIVRHWFVLAVNLRDYS